MIQNTHNSPSLFSNLSDMLNQSHPLYQLADKIAWEKFETAFQPLYCQDNGRPGKPIRLMCGLLILKHLRNLSDESLVEQWSENAYYQYFCGMQEFTPSAPCASSELIHFRKRIGEEGIELIFQESIRVNNEDNEGHHHDTAFIDSTVQEKNVTYPTDAKLHKKIVKKVLGIVKKLGLPLRQSYTFVLKDIYRDRRFRNHPRNREKALRADRRLRTIAGRLVRELKRNLKENHDYDKLLGLFETILSQRRNSRKKVYSIHEPEVQCISKGKEHKKYEFGNKVSIIRSVTGIIQKKHKLFCKRVGIEPTIGHLKSDYRLGRNFYKGVVGDTVNVLLAAATYNFRRAMKALWYMIQKICKILWLNNISQKWAF